MHKARVYALAHTCRPRPERTPWSVKDVAALFHVGKDTVERWATLGLLPDYRTERGRWWFWWAADLQAFLDDPATWLYWHPTQLTDAAWRRRAEAARANAGGRWLGHADLCAWWQTTTACLTAFMKRGGFAGLPTRRVQGRWWWATPQDEAVLQAMADLSWRERRTLARATWPVGKEQTP
jgi:hypothetical protein